MKRQNSRTAKVEEFPGQVTTRTEEKKVEERLALGLHLVYETVRREGEQEFARTNSSLAWSGLAAGLSMGFSFVAESLLQAHLPNATWTPLIAKLGYSVGFLIVILGRQQLFTETTLTVILPILSDRHWNRIRDVLRIWGVILAANLVGTFLFALSVETIAMFTPSVRQAFLDTSQGALSAGFGVTVVRAIFAGWLIALTVWLLPSADTSKVTIIVILTYLIGLGSFNHIIAGSTKVFYMLLAGQVSWADYFGRFFAPTLLGNIIGGVSLVAFLGHAQVVAGKET